MTDLILEATNVHKTFAGSNGSRIQAVEGVNLKVEQGDFIALRGPSGCGKSTLLLTIGGLLQPDQGKVEIAGQNLYEQDSGKRASIRASQVGFVFQQFHLVPYLNALENVLSPTLARAIPDATQKADALLEKFGLSEGAVPSLVLPGKVLDTRNLSDFLQVDDQFVGMFCQGWAELGMPDRFRFSIDCVAGPFVVSGILAARKGDPHLISRQ